MLNDVSAGRQKLMINQMPSKDDVALKARAGVYVEQS